jgi:hypothetical protein
VPLLRPDPAAGELGRVSSRALVAVCGLAASLVDHFAIAVAIMSGSSLLLAWDTPRLALISGIPLIQGVPWLAVEDTTVNIFVVLRSLAYSLCRGWVDT